MRKRWCLFCTFDLCDEEDKTTIKRVRERENDEMTKYSQSSSRLCPLSGDEENREEGEG